MKNYYAILGLSGTATDEDVKRNYRTLAKRYHPDVNPGNAEAAKKFADINEANAVLSDPEKRKAYDSELRAAHARANAARAQSASRGTQQAAQTMAQMQMQAQIQAQIKAQVQAQLLGVRERAFSEGYEKGKADGKAISKQVYGQEAARNKLKATEYARDRSELEEELFERDRELTKSAARIRELEEQLGWFRKATGENQITGMFADNLKSSASRAIELKKEIERLSVSQINVNNNPSAQLDRQKRMKEELTAVNEKLDSLKREIDDWKAKVRAKQQIAEADKYITAAERKARDWANKQKADALLAKPTHYGTLGLLIWATSEEINKAYEKLYKLYSDKSDPENAAKLIKLKTAFAVLSDAKKREEYNRSIGITAQRTEAERKLIRENAAAQDEYRGKLATRAFWVHFDELSALALSGDAEAQNALGEIYYKGETVQRDYVQAVYWFREAVAQKHPAAIYNLGACYLMGHGVTKNRGIGLGFLRQADNLGFRKS